MKSIKLMLLLMVTVLSLFSCGKFSDENITYSPTSNGLVLKTDACQVEIALVREDIIEVSYCANEQQCQQDSSFSVIFEPQKTAFRIKESSDKLTISTSKIKMVVTKSPLAFHYYNPAGDLLLEDSKGFYLDSLRPAIGFRIQEADHYYGMGQKTIDLDRKGYAFDVFNRHLGGYTKPYGNMQVNIPYIYSPVGYGVFIDNPYVAYLDLGKENPHEWYYRASGGQMKYYFTQGNKLQDLQKDYYDLTGYPPLPPKWTFGLLQSKCAYENDTMVYRIVNEFEKKEMPLDAIILDAYWFGGYKDWYPKTMGNFTWLKTNFPDHQKYLDSLHAMGVKTILINEPYINTDSENFEMLKEKGWLVAQKGKEKTNPYIWSPSWCGDNALFDATIPEAREWLWTKFRDFISEGVDGLWIDLTEPERFVPDGEYYLGSHDKMHNIYNNLWARMLYEGYERDFPNQRLFNLTRGGYAGIQRYGAINWSGDASKTWISFKMQVPMLLGCSMSGMPHYSSDIGGFTNAWDRKDGLTLFTNFNGDKILTTPELYVRWFQFGVFSPLLRPHSGEEQYCEPFSHGVEAEAITSKYLDLRYKLVPFLYSYAYKTATSAQQLIRPVFMEFDDAECINNQYDYMYGKELLVAPILEEGQREREVYLPVLPNQEKWIDFWNSKVYEAGQTITVEAPLETIPVFARQGAIIPMAKKKKFVDESPDTELTLTIFPGANASFDLYEDDGLTTGYKKGEFAITNLSTTLTGEQLIITIPAAKGDYKGKVENRIWKFDIRATASASEVLVNGEETKFEVSEGKLKFEIESFTSQDLSIQINGFSLAE